MPIVVKRMKVSRRKPGERANLDPEKLFDAAAAVLDELGLEEFSGRAVAKRLRVSSAAIYLHVDGGLRGLKVALVARTLSEVARPYRPSDTPAGYLRRLALRFLKAINRRQALAQLVACELAADYLLCPQFSEHLLSVLMLSTRREFTAAQKLDLAMAAIVGMALVQAGSVRDDLTKSLAREFKPRLKSLKADDFPTLMENADSLTTEIRRRLVSTDALLLDIAKRHMEPVIAILALGGH